MKRDSYVIKIYFKKKARPYAEIEIDDINCLKELYDAIDQCYNGLEQVKKYVYFYQVIFPVDKFDRAEIVEA